MNDIWNAILEFTARFVIPDWGSVIALLPLVMLVVAVLFFAYVLVRFARVGPRRRGGGPVKPLPPPGVHMPGPTFAPVFAAIGTFLLFWGLVTGGAPLVLGVTALILTLLYWGREGLRDYDQVAGESHPVPAVVHPGPPPGVHMPGPSFRPFLASIGMFILFLGLVFGGWVLAVGVLATIVSLLGWLNDARKEFRHVVAADRTGHIENEPPPGWPKVFLPVFSVLVVAAVVLNLGWFPPRSASGDEGPGGSPAPSGPPANPGEVTIVAQAVKFDITTLTLPADQPIKITFDNRDPNTPHDVDIHQGDTVIFDGADFPGPKIEVYDVPPIPAGSYTFLCSIHPALMTGTLTVG